MGKVVCPARRRLAEARRLAVTTKIDYTVSGLTQADARAAATQISGKSAADLKAAIVTAVQMDTSLNVTITNMQTTSARSVNPQGASFAAAASLTLVMFLLSAVSLLR